MENKEKKLSGYIDTLNEEMKPKEHDYFKADKTDLYADSPAPEVIKNNKAANPAEEYEQLAETVRRIRSLREPLMPEEGFEKSLTASLGNRRPGAEAVRIHRTDIQKKGMSTVMKRSVIGVTVVAAAAVLVFAVPNMKLQGKSPDIAYAMEQAFKEIKAYHGIIEVTETNEAGETELWSSREVWADREGNYYLKELNGYAKGTVTVNNTKKEWQIKADAKKVFVTAAFPDPYRFTFEIGNEVKEVEAADSVKQIGEEKISGRAAILLEITPKGGDAYRLWVDKETKLPLRRQSAMQNAVMITISYTDIEYIDVIPDTLLAFQFPEDYEIVDQNPEQIVSTFEEAKDITGFMPEAPAEVPGDFTLQGISVPINTQSVKMNYMSPDKKKTVVVLESKAAGVMKPASGASIGTVNSTQAEFLNNYEGVSGVGSIRWQENGMEYNIYGNETMDLLADFAKGLSGAEVVLPAMEESNNKPQIEVPYDLAIEENDQKSVDAGHSPWKLDPVFVAQVYASLLISPEGIVGDYPIPYDAISVVSNNGKEAVLQINSDKTIAGKVYLKRLVRQDDTGIWTVVGYDPVD